MLAHPPTASVMRINSGELVELFEGGWLELGEEGLSRVRVIVARHAAPAPGKNIPVGKRVGEWVYELFITVLDTEGFLVEDVFDLYHGRGADRGRCWPMKMSKKTPIAGVRSPSVGKSCGKSPESAVWNLRLSLGQTMQASQLREIEWAPPTEAPAVFIAEDPPPEEYSEWQWAATFGRATGRFGAEDFVLQEDGKLRCPAGASLWLSEVRA